MDRKIWFVLRGEKPEQVNSPFVYIYIEASRPNSYFSNRIVLQWNALYLKTSKFQGMSKNQTDVSLDGGKATHTRFTSEPQITSQNGICGMRLLILTPTHTRVPFRQNVYTFVF